VNCQVEVSGEILELTNLEKNYWSGITKGAFLDYWRQVGPFALPYLADRPLSLLRFPQGSSGKSFWQKNLPPSAPNWLPSYLHRGKTRFLLANNLASLLWAANQGAIELHPWASKIDSPLFPDLAILDLDPVEPWGFAEARQVAFAARKLAEELDLTFYPKTSGSQGIHLYLPLERRYPYSLVTEFMEKFCQVIAQALPELATVERLVKNRKAKVYLDYLQNMPGKTIVAAYCPRSLPGAPISCPLTWEELSQAAPGDLSIATLPRRLEQVGDLWQGVLAGQNIDHALERLGLKDHLQQHHNETMDSKAETPLSQAPPGP
jgi:bifunctional non-homologous end joining protein LigD